MASLRNFQQWAMLEAPKDRWDGKVVKVSKKKDEFRDTVVFTNYYENVFERTDRVAETKDPDGEPVEAVIFEYDRVVRK